MKVSWTDTEKGRQFWVWCTVDEEWVKDIFVTWDDLKKHSALNAAYFSKF